MKIIKRDIKNLNLYYLPNKKFKTVEIAFVFVNKMDPVKINERNFLVDILLESTKKYNNPEKFNLVCDNLYGLDKISNYHTIGDVGLTTFLFRTVNDKYLNQDDVFAKTLDLCLEVIYNPKIHRGYFSKKSVKELKVQTEELIMSIKQNKNSYSYYQFMNEYTKNNQAEFGFFPDIKNIDKINHLTLSSTYKQMVTDDELYVFIAGNFDFQVMDELIAEKLIFVIERPKLPLDFTSKFIPNQSVNEVIEKTSNGQTRIYIGYDLGFEHSLKNIRLMGLFDELFGGFEKAKLFASIRENLNLSYYVYSKYNEDSNMFYVGLETTKEKEAVAIKEVEKQLQACKMGDIDDELFNQAKNNIINRLERTIDSQTRLLLSNIISFFKYEDVFNLEKRIAEIQELTKADLIDLIQKINVDTIYIYTSEAKKWKKN
jgi:predicted Zn-dependent peptidase